MAALLWASCIVYVGFGFSMAVAEPGESAVFTFVFWWVIAAIFAAPFWFPVLVAKRLGTIAGVLRLGSLVGLLLVALVAGHQFYFDLNRSIQGHEVTFIELFLDALVTGVSALSAFIVFQSNSREIDSDA